MEKCNSSIGKKSKEVSLEKSHFLPFDFLLQESAFEFFKKRNQSFKTDNYNLRFYELISDYWRGNLKPETQNSISLTKGLFIFGSIGSGKTSSFDIIREIYYKYGYLNFWFPKVLASDIVSEYNSSQEKEKVIQYYSRAKLLIDDLGKEEIANNNYQYGKVDILKTILYNRHLNFEKRGIITHITTNLTMREVGERYGLHIADRLQSMVNQLELLGPSRR